MIGKYAEALEYDLRAHLRVSLLELWQTRRWRKLLNYIDHLPRNTWYSQAVASDEEHAKLLQEAREASGREPEPYAPPMSAWTQESELLATVVDEIRGLNALTSNINSKPGSKPRGVKPFPRPKTVMAKANFSRRQQAHEALAARMLPHKNKAQPQGLGVPVAPTPKTPNPLTAMPRRKGTWRNE